jgi:septum formation protein
VSPPGPQGSPGPRLILASGSPQRRAILEQIGVSFEIRVSDAQELEQGPPHEVALENAYRKAAAVAADTDDGDPPVLGVDTLVSLGSRIYGKPRDRADAGRMLSELSGRRHLVISAVCVIDHGEPRSASAGTVVEFQALDAETVDDYLQTGEWRGRAGAYAVQGRGATLVRRIEGDYLSVVGLPVATLLELLPGLLRSARGS